MNTSFFLRPAAFLLPAFVVSVTACGGNHFDVTVDGTPANYNHGVSGTLDTGRNTITITGRADPVANASDDEYNDILHIDFGNTVPNAAPRNTALPIRGVAHIAISSEGGTPPLDQGVTFEPAAGDAHTPVIARIWLERSCFCGFATDHADESFVGTMTLEDAGSGALRVRTNLTLDGPIPLGGSGAQHTTIAIDTIASPPTR